MIIGIVILCVAILLIFFGLAERFFRKLGIANWLAFLIVLALVIGAVIPNIHIGNSFTINVSGFLIPIIVMVIFEVLIGFGGDFYRSLLAQISVAALAVAVRLLMPDNTSAMIVSTSLIIGFLAGAAAYLITQTRTGVIVGTMGGIVLGDIVMGLIEKFVFDKNMISLGTGGVFNSIIMAVLFGLILLEAINAMIRATSRKRVNSETLSFEAAEDYYKEHSENDKNRKSSLYAPEEKDKTTNANRNAIEFEEFGEYNDYFDDKLL